MKTKDLTLIGIMTALMAVISPMSLPLPFTPVMITLATFMVYICPAIAGYKKGCIVVVLYILLGAVGLPIFSGYGGGIGKILGPTGGYLIGFIFCAFCTGFAAEKFPNKKIPLFLGMLLGSVAYYVTGTLWFMAVMSADGVSLAEAVMLCVIPFIPGDVIKMIIATVMSGEIRKRLEA